MPRSIATKVSVAALSLTMAVVVVLGTASYVFTRHALKEQIEEKLLSEALLVGNRLETRLGSIVNDMRNMASNLIVVNALIDSAGREMYVEPFLRSYHLPFNIPCLLTLCDFSGNPIISCQGREKMRTYADQSLLAQVVDGERPVARLEGNDTAVSLLIAHPVFYGATGRAEGMLVLEIPFHAVITSCLPQELLTSADGLFFILSGASGRIWSSAPQPDATHQLSNTVSLKTAAPLDSLSLAMTVGQDPRQAYAPLSTLTTIYLLIGCGVLLLVHGISRTIAKRLTAPLVDLTSTANRIAQTGNPEEHITIASNDEITQLASSFNTMLARLHESQASLELRVEERTRELLLLSEQLRNEVHERTLAEEKTREYAGMQKVLLEEVNHRVKNNMVAIISMLHREEDLAEREGKLEYVARIREVVWRVTGLLTVHRLLSSSSWQPLPLTQLAENIIQETLKGLPPSTTIQLMVSPSDIRVDSDQAHHLAMVLNELSTNTIKYGLLGRHTGVITVSIGEINGFVELTYRDDGPGFPDAVLQGAGGGGIGFPLLFGLITRSLRGKISLANDHGAVATISFPAMSTAHPTDGEQPAD
ncbi:MAG: HAMP domain-containing protein [Thermodesulfobacteriota bacterium]